MNFNHLAGICIPQALSIPLLLATAVLAAKAQPTPVPGRVPQAPPPAPPVQVSTAPWSPPPHTMSGGTLYSIGQPTDEEQLYLEYINRSRANPTAEGVRLANATDPDVVFAYAYFHVDLNLMMSEFSTNPPVPPLAMNAKLMAAARLHSGDMYTYQYQGHTGTDGSNPGQRITAQGYAWYTYGENVYASAESVFHGHAGFNVDWGSNAPSLGGMQLPPGHRNSINSAAFREVGVGVVDGVNGSVGPQVVTQDFGTQQSASPFITGVVYYDLNGNGFYDVGEGIGGVTVTVPASSYYAVTADSGGYAVPCSTNGSYAMTFTATNLSAQKTAVIAGGGNVKVDYVPAYSPPTITGPNPAYLNASNYYTFSPVGAATSYDWQQTQLAAYTAVEGAENGLANVMVVSSPGYSVIINDLVASGSAAFHLAQPDFGNQYLTLNPVLRINAGSQLTFAKRLGYATANQIAKAQISADGGASWTDVWNQAGTGSSGDSSYTTNTVSLTAYAGQVVQVRFAYVFTSGQGYTQTDSIVGLCLDNISVSNADQLANQVTTSIPSGTSFALSPTNTANYLLQVRAHINSRTLPWGPPLTVSVISPPPVIQLAGRPSISAGQIQLDFNVSNFRTGMTFQLWKASAVNGTYTQDTSAALQTLVPNSQYRFSTPTGSGTSAFYRVKASY